VAKTPLPCDGATDPTATIRARELNPEGSRRASPRANINEKEGEELYRSAKIKRKRER